MRACTQSYSCNDYYGILQGKALLENRNESLSLFRSWPFSGWSDGKTVRCPPPYPSPVAPEQNSGGPFQATHSWPGRGGGAKSQCVKKAFTWWECGILEEDWGRKKMRALLKNEVSSWQDFLLIFPETPKIKHFFCIFTYSDEAFIKIIVLVPQILSLLLIK